MQWMEFGKSIWTGSNFTDNKKMRRFQAEYYRRFFDMLLAGHTAGMFCWWFTAATVSEKTAISAFLIRTGATVR